MSQPTHYTHAVWRVRPGNEAEFVAQWKSLAETFTKLDRPPLWGTLLRSEIEPNVFFSFGPWNSAEDIAVMRADPTAQSAFESLFALCDTATPGACSLIAHVVA